MDYIPFSCLGKKEKYGILKITVQFPLLLLRKSQSLRTKHKNAKNKKEKVAKLPHRLHFFRILSQSLKKTGTRTKTNKKKEKHLQS